MSQLPQGKRLDQHKSLSALGLFWTIKLEAHLPQDKVEGIKEALSEWECKKTCTLKELESLIGTLNFACKVVPPGRSFLTKDDCPHNRHSETP